jgi:DNA-binding PadR family transcriptional regulator
MRITPLDELLPLSPQTAAILLMLASGPMYGYLIAERIKSVLGLAMSSGSLYPGLRRLVDVGLVQDAGTEAGTASPNVRHLYALTDFGYMILKLEAKRQSHFVSQYRAARHKRYT